MPTILEHGQSRDFSWERLEYLAGLGLVDYCTSERRFRLVKGKTWADVDAVCTACRNGIHTPGISGMPRPCLYCQRQHYPSRAAIKKATE
jgi:hypothetical protein